LMVRSESLEMSVRTDLSVCSLTTGATSVNPVTYTVSIKCQLRGSRRIELTI
jgi:hypothetical protein